MVILHITSIANPDGNGVAVAVNNYIKYEQLYAKIGLYNLEGSIENDCCESYSAIKYKTIESLPKPFSNPDLVVFNEVYKPMYIPLYKECIKRNIRYVIIPHGCLVKKSQKKKRIKKFLGNHLIFNKFIYNANAVQFLNEKEEQESKKFKRKKTLISGNGIDTTAVKFGKADRFNFVYIGRYELYIKGLDLLICVCRDHYDWFKNRNIIINLYGRDASNGLLELRKMIVDNNLEDIIKLNGAVYGKEKEKVLLKAYAFIQLSRHEGQPMGIIEALAYGVPCIVTYGTSFGDYINDNNCGFGCNFDKEEVFSNIKKIVENNKLRNLQSKNAFDAMKKDFDWKNIIPKIIEEYKEV